MEELISISNNLYRVMSGIVGPEEVIDIRRMVMDVERGVDSVIRMFDIDVEERIRGGSRIDGLRFVSSDFDFLHVRRGIRAVFSSFLSSVNDTQQTILLAETEEAKPGFALLRLMLQYQSCVDEQVMKSLVKCASGYYVRSTLWIKSRDLAKRLSHLSVHGPCLSGTLAGYENDFAECIKSDQLPDIAYNSLLTLYRKGKISYHDLQDICLKGCYFVAINSRRPVHEGLEWRISFSFAEKKIIQSFNHSQLMCYGLLKIFLKEAIETNTEIDGLLWSYFVKTVVLWMSLGCSVHWTPDNLLCCFLKCFQLLINWVNNEYCPNFFIPQNNMFADKLSRTQHSTLLNHLSGLYRLGYLCLFMCPSIRDRLIVIQLPDHVDMLLSMQANTSKSYVDCTLIQEVWNNKPIVLNNFTNPAILQYLGRQESAHQYRISCMNIWKYLVYSNTAFRIGSQERSSLETNSRYYRQCRAITATLQTCEFDASSNLLYRAIYLYRIDSVNNVIRIINKTKKRLRHKCIMYPWTLNHIKYALAGGENRPINDMMRTVIAFPVILDKETCIPELLLESLCADYRGTGRIIIPPTVCATFLGYLCHFKLGEYELATSALQELLTLLINRNEYHIYESDRAISWEILGICQEMSGDYQGCYHSYGSALQQKWCQFKTAVFIRLIGVLYIG